MVPRPTSPAAAEKREERGALGPQRGPNPLLRRGGAAARFRRSANLFPLLFLLPQRSVRSGGEEDDPCLVRATPALLPLSFSVASEAQLPAPPPVPCVFLAPCLSRHGLRAQQGVFTCAHCPGSDAGGLHRGRRRGLGFAPCFSSPCPPTSSATLDFLPSAPGGRLTARRVQLPGLAEPWTLPGLRPRGVWA